MAATASVEPAVRRSSAELRTFLAGGGRTLVALSGGVDSSVVAALLYEALGAEALAVTLGGPAVSRSEIDAAREVASGIGIRHRVLSVDPLVRSEYRANPQDRCYFCRAVETAALREYGASHGVRRYVDGVHRDDLADDRPGLRAMDEAGFEHPLLWAGWSKADVRAEAERRGLPNRDRPSDACLSSRVAHGLPLTAELLGRIEAAERLLRDRGFRRVRVRVSATGARLVVGPDEVVRLLAEPIASELRASVRALGFDPVTIDPVGYPEPRARLAVVP